MRSSDNIGDLAKELGVGRRCLYKRQAKLGFAAGKTNHLEPGEEAPRTNSHESRRLWRDGIYDQLREVIPLQGNLGIEGMCERTTVSRASFCRSFHKQQPVEEELQVRSAIQQIAIEHRRRRISAELRRRGIAVNH